MIKKKEKENSGRSRGLKEKKKTVGHWVKVVLFVFACIFDVCSLCN